jgi:hypothetical protein
VLFIIQKLTNIFKVKKLLDHDDDVVVGDDDVDGELEGEMNFL